MSPIAIKVREALLSAKETLNISGSHRNMEYKIAVTAWNEKATANKMFAALVNLQKQFDHQVKYLTQTSGPLELLNKNAETAKKIDSALIELKAVLK